MKSIPGLKHYYPLNHNARDAHGSLHGVAHGVSYASGRAVFDGDDYIELPASKDFSPARTGRLSILVFQTVTDWRANRQGGDYVHWFGKGEPGKHEYTFRYYPDDDVERPKRTSFYVFNAAGGEGAGSYFQDDDSSGTERVIVGRLDRTVIEMWKNGVKRDSDLLSGYGVELGYTTAPVRIGTRDKTTGYLVGKVRRVAFFDRKLTAAEIRKLYDNRGLGD